VFQGNPYRSVDEARAAQDAQIELTEFFLKTVAEQRRNKGNVPDQSPDRHRAQGEVLTEEGSSHNVSHCFSPAMRRLEI
jgi:hypothetical protein